MTFGEIEDIPKRSTGKSRKGLQGNAPEQIRFRTPPDNARNVLQLVETARGAVLRRLATLQLMRQAGYRKDG